MNYVVRKFHETSAAAAAAAADTHRQIDRVYVLSVTQKTAGVCVCERVWNNNVESGNDEIRKITTGDKAMMGYEPEHVCARWNWMSSHKYHKRKQQHRDYECLGDHIYRHNMVHGMCVGISPVILQSRRRMRH